MGSLSRSAIVAQGLNVAGDTSLTTLANVFLNAWLQNAARKWPYPQNRRTISGVALAQGATSLLLGAGSNGVTPQISKIFDPLTVYDSAYTTNSKIYTRQVGGTNDQDERALDPSNNTGLPQLARIRAVAATQGRWTFTFDKIPDRAYLLAIDYQEIPVDLSTTSTDDSTVPWYPNDQTMIEAVRMFGRTYMEKDDRYELQDRVGKMVIDDRNAFGYSNGINDALLLDPKVFL